MCTNLAASVVSLLHCSRAAEGILVEVGNLVAEGGNLAVEGGNLAVEGGNLAVEGGNSAVERVVGHIPVEQDCRAVDKVAGDYMAVAED